MNTMTPLPTSTVAGAKVVKTRKHRARTLNACDACHDMKVRVSLIFFFGDSTFPHQHASANTDLASVRAFAVPRRA